MSEYSNSATVQLLGFGGRIGRWMSDCIAALVADFAGTASAAGRGVLVAVDAERTTVSGRQRAGTRQVLGTLANSGGVPPVALVRELPRRARGDATLRLGAGKAVVSRIGLPAAALDVLPAVVRNKVESLAPWPLAEALWGYRVVETPAKGQLAVDVGIVSRRTLDTLLGALSAAGLKVSYLEIDGGIGADPAAAIPVDFLAEHRNRRARRSLWMLLGALAAVALAIAAYGLFLAITANEELAAIEARIDTLQQALHGKRAAGGGPKLAAANQLFDRKRDSRPLVVLLDDLTHLVPDGTWLTALNYDGTRLTITGHGSETPKLVQTLEKSPAFADVNFAAATQRDPDGNGETFSISAAIEGKAAAP